MYGVDAAADSKRVISVLALDPSGALLANAFNRRGVPWLDAAVESSATAGDWRIG
jgi:hypothetical protein